MKEVKKYRIKPGSRFRWSDVDPDDHGRFADKEAAVEETEAVVGKLDLLQERLYAENKRALLIILQAVDTGGKDGTIRHVMRGINPQGCQVTSFKVPTPEERAHDFLWRVHQHVPRKGYIGIFNRSHYEDILVTRVHNEISHHEAKQRFTEINDFEKTLVNNSTTILKFYLAISREEQRKRLQERLEDPEKHWKFSPSDVTERRYWNRYTQVYADAITHTSMEHAPWYLIPANHKWFRNYLVAKIIAETLEQMNPQFPPAPPGVDLRKVKIPA